MLPPPLPSNKVLALSDGMNVFSAVYYTCKVCSCCVYVHWGCVETAAALSVSSALYLLDALWLHIDQYKRGEHIPSLLLKGESVSWEGKDVIYVHEKDIVGVLLLTNFKVAFLPSLEVLLVWVELPNSYPKAVESGIVTDDFSCQVPLAEILKVKKKDAVTNNKGMLLIFSQAMRVLRFR